MTKKKKKYIRDHNYTHHRNNQQKLYIDNFKHTILLNQHRIWVPTPENHHIKSFSTDSWFYFSEYQETKPTPIVINKIPVKNKTSYKTIYVTLRPDKFQKALFNSWMQAFKIIYKETINYIRRLRNQFGIIFHNFITIRNTIKPLINYVADESYKHNQIYIWKKRLIHKEFNYRQNKKCNFEIKKLQQKFKKNFKFGHYKTFDKYSTKISILEKSLEFPLQLLEMQYQDDKRTIKKQNKQDKFNNLLLYQHKKENKQSEYDEKKLEIYEQYKKGQITEKKRDNKIKVLDIKYSNNSYKASKAWFHGYLKLCHQCDNKLIDLSKQYEKNKNTLLIGNKFKRAIFHAENYDSNDYINYTLHLKNYKKTNGYKEAKNILLANYCINKSDKCRSKLQELKNQCMKHKSIGTKHNEHECVSYNKSNIYGRMLVEAVDLACSNIKTCVSNVKNGIIRKFSLRKMGLGKDTHMLKIENCYFTRGSFLGNIVGPIKAYKDSLEFNLSNIGINKLYSSTCTLKYERKKRRYSLLIPIEVASEDYLTKACTFRKEVIKPPPLTPQQKIEQKEKAKIKRKEKNIKRKINKELKKKDFKAYQAKMQRNKNKRKDGRSERTIKKQNRKTRKMNEKKELNKKDVKINKDEYISIDPGLRSFCTGISENKVVKIGNNLIEKTKNNIINLISLDKIRKINSKLLEEKVESMKANEEREYRKRHNNIKKKFSKIRNFIETKIENVVNDLHWKSINYLTSNYKNVLIGDMNTKSIVKKETSKLSEKLKYLASRCNLGKYRNRLEWRCGLTKTGYKLIDERYTSKMCSICGYLKEDLCGNKQFNCNNCKISLDRDINGARNIYLKTYMVT
jgi:transposase